MSSHVIRNKTLAGMIASENINVIRDPEATTAYFNSHTKTITLPEWHDISPEMNDMLIMHEVGHARFSPNEFYQEEKDALLRAYVNVLDDVRVDRLQQLEFPGCKKDYHKAAQGLIDEGIIPSDQETLSSLNLIDKINTYAKIGRVLFPPLQFDEEEIAFLKKAYVTTSFEECIELAKEIIAFSKTKKKKQEQGEDISSSGNTVSQSTHIQEQEYQDNEETSTEEEEDQDFNEDSLQSMTANAVDDYMKQKIKPHSPVKAAENKIPDVYTVGTSRGKQIFLNRDGVLQRIKEIIDIVDGKKTISEASEHPFSFKEMVDITKYGRRIIKEEKEELKDAILALQEEFDRRKQARVISYLQTDKGKIDTDLLSLYKIKDNVFLQRVMQEKNEQNHRIIFLMDLSGSMINEYRVAKKSSQTSTGIKEIFAQMVVFKEFCRREGIKFTVLGYTCPSVGLESTANLVRKLIKHEDIDQIKQEYSSLLPIQQYFVNNQEMLLADVKQYVEKEKQKNKSFKFNANIMQLYDVFAEMPLVLELFNETTSEQEFDTFYLALGFMTQSQMFRNLMTGYLRFYSTPLNRVLTELQSWIIDTRTAMQEDKLDLIIMTDGDSNNEEMTRKTIIRNDISKREYLFEDIYPLFEGESVIGKATFAHMTSGMIALKELKEEDILDKVLWFNYMGDSNITHSRFKALVQKQKVEKMGKSLDNSQTTVYNFAEHNEDFYQDVYKLIFNNLKKKGFHEFKQPFPYIDTVVFYIAKNCFLDIVDIDERSLKKKNNRLKEEDRTEKTIERKVYKIEEELFKNRLARKYTGKEITKILGCYI